jgi:ABC-type sugar transport system permease subunit
VQREHSQAGVAKYSDQKTREERVMKQVFLSPAIAILLLLSIFPTFWSLGISFTDMQRGRGAAATTGEQPGLHVTAQNYSRMLGDQRLYYAARNTVFYVFAGVTIQFWGANWPV